MNSFAHHTGDPDGIEPEARPTLLNVSSLDTSPEEKISVQEFSQKLFGLLDTYGKRRRDKIEIKKTSLNVTKLSQEDIDALDESLVEELKILAHAVADMLLQSKKNIVFLEQNEHIIRFQQARVFGNKDFLALVWDERSRLRGTHRVPQESVIREITASDVNNVIDELV